MIQELEQLSLALSQISKEEAKRVADAVNGKVLDLVNAQVITLYWIGEAQGGVLLTPVAFINKTQSEDPRPFQLRPDHRILPWVFIDRRPLWLEGLVDAGDHQPTTKTLVMTHGEHALNSRT